MGKSGSGKVGTSQESKRGNGKKPTYNYIPLPKMLQMGIATGKEQERERIIKLLADSFDWNNSVTVDRDELIALITGETND
jgi:hypothetical protein